MSLFRPLLPPGIAGRVAAPANGTVETFSVLKVNMIHKNSPHLLELDAFKIASQQGLQEIGLAREIVVDQSLADARLTGDPLHADAGYPF